MIRWLSFHDFAAAQAGSANTDALVATLHFGVDRAQIDVPAPLGHVVGVADVISKLRASSATAPASLKINREGREGTRRELMPLSNAANSDNLSARIGAKQN